MFLQGDKGTITEYDAKQKIPVITAHACFLIRAGSHREEFIRELADSLLTRLKITFPQVLIDLGSQRRVMLQTRSRVRFAIQYLAQKKFVWGFCRCFGIPVV